MKQTTGDIVRGALKRYGVKQSEMARIMRISQQALSRKMKLSRMTIDDLRIIDKRAPFTDEECRLLIRSR